MHPANNLSTCFLLFGAIDMLLLVQDCLLVRGDRKIRCRLTCVLVRTVFFLYLLRDPLFEFAALSLALAMLVQNAMLYVLFVVCMSATHIMVVVAA